MLWLMISIPIGILSALRPRSLLDRVTMVFVLIGISAHPVWIGLLGAYFIGFKLHLVPITGYCDLVSPTGDCGGPIQWAYHLILPWCTFAVLFAAIYVRMIRAYTMETLGEDFVRTARAKGASEPHVLRNHVLRNALLPVVTILGMDVGLALGRSTACPGSADSRSARSTTSTSRRCRGWSCSPPPASSSSTFWSTRSTRGSTRESGSRSGGSGGGVQARQAACRKADGSEEVCFRPQCSRRGFWGRTRSGLASCRVW